MDDQGSKTVKLTLVSSPTKPGPGWIQVTPENIRMFEDYIESSRIMREKLADLMSEIADEMGMSVEELRAWIRQDANK
jgi:hypothetical protein